MPALLKTFFATFQGKQADGVIQYLGVKYASVKDKLAPPEMMTKYGPGIINATESGPRAPAMDGCAFEQSTLIQCSIGAPENAPPMSGTECLNLNITVPDIDPEKRRQLPVMVFIHGGGFMMGANYWPQYDSSRLVKLSADIGMPVIVEYIDAFGGDVENVTAFGESAGSASVVYQLRSKEPLFKRAISMSGKPLMLKPLLLPEAEMAYESILKSFGLENAPTDERIRQLQTASPEDLIDKTPTSVLLLPFLDGDVVPRMSVPSLSHQDTSIVPEKTTFADLLASDIDLSSSIPGWKWCKSLIIGDSHHDGNVFLFMGLLHRRVGIASALTSSLHKNISQDAAAEILEAYQITPATSDDKAMERIIDLGTDIAYVAPALAYARSFPGKRYYYNFNEPNPWDGPFNGCSTHMLNAALLFQNFNEHLSEEAKKVAKMLATDFVRFANGMKPWDEYTKKEEVKAFGPSRKRVCSVAERNGWGGERRDVLWRLSEDGKVDLDGLSVAWDLFVAGR